MSERLPLRDLMGWPRRRGRRPRLRPIARWLHVFADRLYPDVTYTIKVTTCDGERTYVNCREWRR